MLLNGVERAARCLETRLLLFVQNLCCLLDLV